MHVEPLEPLPTEQSAHVLLGLLLMRAGGNVDGDRFVRNSRRVELICHDLDEHIAASDSIARGNEDRRVPASGRGLLQGWSGDRHSQPIANRLLGTLERRRALRLQQAKERSAAQRHLDLAVPVIQVHAVHDGPPDRKSSIYI